MFATARRMPAQPRRGLGVCRLHRRNRLFHTTDPLRRMNCGSVARMASTIAPRPEWRITLADAKRTVRTAASTLRRISGAEYSPLSTVQSPASCIRLSITPASRVRRCTGTVR